MKNYFSPLFNITVGAGPNGGRAVKIISVLLKTYDINTT
jgi:hypothetical protein